MIINENCECCKSLAEKLKEYDEFFEGHATEVTDLEIKLYEKTKECEELRDKLNTHIDSMNKQNEKLFNENKQLKAEIINRNEKIEELRFSVSDLTNRLCSLNAEKTFGIVNYKQALQEIKQLTIEAKTKQFVDMEDFWEQILQKCEVLDGR